MAAPFDNTDDTSPYGRTVAGLRRRQAFRDAAAAIDPTRLELPANANDNVMADRGWLEKTVDSQTQRFASSIPALGALGAKLVGADETAQDWARNAVEMDERATRLGPEVQGFDQVDGVGSALSAAGYQAAGLLPDLALTLTGAGAGATIAKRVGINAAKRGLLRGMERRGTVEAAQLAAGREAGLLASKAPGATRASMVDAMKIARVEAREGLEKQAADKARRLVGLRTPRAGSINERLSTYGQRAGVIAGQFPSLNRDNASLLADENTTQADAGTLLAGTTLASAAGILPVERWLGKFGGDKAVAGVMREAQKAKRAATGARFRELTKEMGREAALQAMSEGGTEGLQQFIQRGTQSFVDNNIELFSPEAFREYGNAVIGGAILGGGLGAAGAGARGAHEAASDMARATGRKVKDVAMSGVDRLKKSMADWPALDGLTLDIAPSMPTMGHGSPGNENPVASGDGHYTGLVNFTMAGPWQVIVTVSREGGTLGEVVLEYAVR